MRADGVVPDADLLAGMDWLVDDFAPLADQALTEDPLAWPGYPAALERARQRTGDDQAVTAGRAQCGGHACMLVAFNFAFMGGSMGEAEGRRIGAAIAVATNERLPLVTVLRSGGARMQEGMRSLIQMQRVARGLTELAAAHLPHVSIVRHPTTGGVWASLGAAADVILAEEGAEVAFAGSRVRHRTLGGAGAPRLPADTDSTFSAAGQAENGFIDAVHPGAKLRAQLALLLELLSPTTRGAPVLPELPRGRSTGKLLTGWEQVGRARARGRPTSDDYLREYFACVFEIHGDRVGGVDPSVRCGFGHHGGRTIAFIAQSGASTRAAGYRVARRLVELAGRLQLPILTLIDSPGADDSAANEAAGVGSAVADLLRAVAASRVPILSLTVGQGGSGGTLALTSPDNLWITADGYFSVIAPEAATAILKCPQDEVPSIASRLRLAPEDLEELGIVRGVVEE